MRNPLVMGAEGTIFEAGLERIEATAPIAEDVTKMYDHTDISILADGTRYGMEERLYYRRPVWP